VSVVRVIFVGTGNAARSQMAEALLRKEAGDRFEVVSGGTKPQPVHPMAVASLSRVGLDASGAESKSVMRFAAQPFDYVITVCDRARTVCPVFPGEHELLHWGIDDPAEVEGSDEARQAAYDRALREISGRVRSFVAVAAPRVA
jgi:arsenate reductase